MYACARAHTHARARAHTRVPARAPSRVGQRVGGAVPWRMGAAAPAWRMAGAHAARRGRARGGEAGAQRAGVCRGCEPGQTGVARLPPARARASPRAWGARSKGVRVGSRMRRTAAGYSRDVWRTAAGQCGATAQPAAAAKPHRPRTTDARRRRAHAPRRRRRSPRL